MLEHLKPSVLYDDQFEFGVEFCSKYNDLVRACFASKHSNSKSYVATVRFSNEDEDEPIQSWFCTCSAGAGVIGCCAHITALIWHLGVRQSEIIHRNSELSATKFLQTVRDCIQYSYIEESHDEYDNSETSDSDET